MAFTVSPLPVGFISLYPGFNARRVGVFMTHSQSDSCCFPVLGYYMFSSTYLHYFVMFPESNHGRSTPFFLFPYILPKQNKTPPDLIFLLPTHHTFPERLRKVCVSGCMLSRTLRKTKSLYTRKTMSWAEGVGKNVEVNFAIWHQRFK